VNADSFFTGKSRWRLTSKPSLATKRGALFQIGTPLIYYGTDLFTFTLRAKKLITRRKNVQN
jgi:hypothetical protein